MEVGFLYLSCPVAALSKVTSHQLVKAIPEIYPWPVMDSSLPPVDVP